MKRLLKFEFRLEMGLTKSEGHESFWFFMNLKNLAIPKPFVFEPNSGSLHFGSQF